MGWGDGGNNPFKNNKNTKIFVFDISKVNTIKGINKISYKEACKNKFDLIICSHVLEHVSYPRKLLKNIYKIMNIKDSNALLINKKHWHEHINFFSKDSIKAMLIKSNLKLISLNMLNTKDDKTKRSVFQVLVKKLN